MYGVAETKTVRCGGCEKKCGLILTLKEGIVIDIAGDKDDAISQGHKCKRADRAIGYKAEQAEMILKKPPRGGIPICPA